MQLDGAQQKELHRVLLAAFPNLLELTRLVRFQLDQNLAELTTGGDLRTTMFELIKWAVQHDRLPELVSGAYRENPDSGALRRLAVRLGLPLDGAPGPSQASLGTLAATGDRVLICLVGEQPVANLLPILHYRPAHVVLAHSDYTRGIAVNVERALDWTSPVTLCEVDAFAIERARSVLLDLIVRQGWASGDLLFNLTGGTKPMSLAGYRVAQDFAGCTLIYMQTRQGRNECFEYTLSGTSFVLTAERREITTVLDIDRHLRVHGLGEWSTTLGDTSASARFTQLIADTLTGYVDEVVCHVQAVPGSTVTIDLVIRCRNQLGLIAVASEAADEGMEGIGRLNTFGAREHLGSHVQRLLALDRDPALNTDAQATAQHIGLLVLSSFAASGGRILSEEDQRRLRTQVMQALGRW